MQDSIETIYRRKKKVNKQKNDTRQKQCYKGLNIMYTFHCTPCKKTYPQLLSVYCYYDWDMPLYIYFYQTQKNLAKCLKNDARLSLNFSYIIYLHLSYRQITFFWHCIKKRCKWLKEKHVNLVDTINNCWRLIEDIFWS